jgi:hypothetical protein
MAVQEISRLLRILAEEEQEGIRRRYGADATVVAEDIQDLVAVRLQEESPNSALWEAFQRDPRANSAELVGTLEALVEADPALTRRLDAYLEEFHEAMQRSAAQEPTETEQVADEGPPPSETPGMPQLGTPVTREPYYPDTGALTEHESVAGDGTYLYGNVKDGKEQIGGDVGVGPFDFGERVRAVRLENLAGLPAFFDALFATLDDIQEVPLNRRLKIQSALQDIKEEIRRDEDADQERMTQRLIELQDTAPAVGEAIMQALEAIETAPPVTEAVRAARGADR